MEASFKQLVVWQKAMNLVRMVYRMSKTFPPDERFALTDQLRRAVVSIPSNIAEGNGRGTSKDYAHFLNMARGSLFEVRTQLELAVRLGYFSVSEELSAQIDSISKMLFSMSRKLAANQ